MLTAVVVQAERGDASSTALVQDGQELPWEQCAALPEDVRVTDELVRFTGTPALCVGVLSSRGDDLVLRTTRHARAGLPRYWIVDPRDGRLSAYTLHEGLYQRTAQLQVSDDAPGHETAARRARPDLGPVEVDVDLVALLEL